MLIERVQVDDGFLSGLDIEFAPGLNVLIGARGTGKTSLIELIRFALGASAFTEDAGRRGSQQALSVLQGGEVTVVLLAGDDRFVVTRGSRDEGPRTTRSIPPATVLAQSEIEAVGAQAVGRLHLIDRFRPRRGETDRRGSTLIARLRSVTAEISGVRDELRGINDQVQQMHSVREERVNALAQQQELLKSIAATAKDRGQLAELQARAAVLGVRAGVYERTGAALDNFVSGLDDVVQALPEVEGWPDGAGPEDLLAEVRASRAEALEALERALQVLRRATAEVQDLVRMNTADRVTADEGARVSRRALDELQAGAGALTRRVEELTEREAQLSTLERLAAERVSRVSSLQSARRMQFEELEVVRNERFESRSSIASNLNAELEPEIRVEVIDSGITERYANAIAAALRGSGLHYNTLAPLLAARMSPLELVEAVESANAQAIADATEIALDRAASAIAHLQQSNLSELVASPIDDAVELYLLDGIDHKASWALSIGQRCTAVLPVLFSGHGELLIVDQPEDHLDNAFIMETLVERLRGREAGDQFILASHNANIPVLGDADLVIRLGSDGRRGFVEHAGELDDPTTVRAITAVMEGGVEAFERRAAFYRGVLGNSHA